MAKNDQKSAERLNILNQNRFDGHPEGFVYRIGTPTIAKFIAEAGVNCGVDPKSLRINIEWNPLFDNVIREGRTKKVNEPPIKVTVFYSWREKKSENNKGGKVFFAVGDRNCSKELLKAFHSTNDKKQLDMMNDEGMNRFLQLFTRGNKVKWKTTKNSTQLEIPLDPILVLERMFAIDSKEARGKALGIMITHAAGPGVKQARDEFRKNGGARMLRNGRKAIENWSRGNNPYQKFHNGRGKKKGRVAPFTMTITKIFQNQTFKDSRATVDLY